MCEIKSTERYALVEGTVCGEEKTIATYGICVNHSAASGEESFGDVSTQRERVAELVERCNRLDLHPVHLKDVVEDFLIADSL